MVSLFDKVAFTRGPAMANRFMLAPLTNLQSHPDGVMSDDEFRWLVKRAEGGFGAAIGQGFPGQLGIFGDQHLSGLSRLAAAIKKHESVALAQLHHAGMRSPEALIGQKPVAPSDNEETGARGLTLGETERLVADFVAAAERAEHAGFDGVEIHGAHSYILCQYLAAGVNKRTDRYGGSAENRARIVLEIIDGVRARCRRDFTLGLRLSPERFDLKLSEIRDLATQVMTGGKLDFLDMSLWDAFKLPEEEDERHKNLTAHFADLPRGETKLGAAGKIRDGASAQAALDAGLDFVLIGRAAILHHDFPERVRQSAAFTPIATPVSEAYLRDEGLGPAFVTYMRTWKGFVAEEAA